MKSSEGQDAWIEIPDQIRTQTRAISEAFLQHSLNDPAFQYSLLVMAFPGPNSQWRDGEPWGARVFTGRNRLVTGSDVARTLPLGALHQARDPASNWNIIWWLIGLKPDGSGVVMRVFTENVVEPIDTIQDRDWAIAKFARLEKDLAQ